MDFVDVMSELTDLVDRLEDRDSEKVEVWYSEIEALRQILSALKILFGHEDIVKWDELG